MWIHVSQVHVPHFLVIPLSSSLLLVIFMTYMYTPVDIIIVVWIRVSQIICSVPCVLQHGYYSIHCYSAWFNLICAFVKWWFTGTHSHLNSDVQHWTVRTHCGPIGDTSGFLCYIYHHPFVNGWAWGFPL